MFDKNLEAIDNIALKRRLARISPIQSRIGMSYCVTASNDYILLKNDIPSDDLNNPREAIRKHLSENIKQEMLPNDIIITFGIGLGYLLDETYARFPSKIFIYEPDLNLLHFVLNNVDISEHLSSGRVFITNDLDELIHRISETFLTKDKVEIVYLQNYAIVKNKELLLLTQKVFETCKSKMVDVNTITRFSKKWLFNTIENLGFISKEQGYALTALEEKFSGQTALIAAAGPSLNDNIAKIQANRDKFVILAVNKAVKYLLQNGITPDFVVCLDASYIEETIGGLGEQLARTNCIMDLRTDSTITSYKFNKIFFNFSSSDFLAKKLSSYNLLKQYETGGTASTLALMAAIKMGFSKIVFTGLDLAFKENIIYTDGSKMERISQNQILVNSVKKNLVQVKSVTNSPVYTRDDYATFIHHFETLIKSLNFSEIYNTTTFGAYIEGIKNVSFEEICSQNSSQTSQINFVQPIKLDLKSFIDDEFKTINDIISILSKGVFSSALVSTIVKSVLVYQYLQADVVNVLQKNFSPDLAESFIEKTKLSIKAIVEQLQKNRLI